MNNYIATPSRTKEIMKKHHFSVKKSLGQNFLIDVNILTHIIDAAGIDENANVIEIGPGIGSLTEQLALRAKKVVAFEIDQRLKPVLESTLKPYDNIKIIFEDILKSNLKEVIKNEFSPGEKIHIVANLPYYITTPILLRLLHDQLPIDTMTVMMQKEVAERMAAEPNTKAYGSLTIAVQYYTNAEIVMDVPKTVFLPQPNVMSSVLHLDLKEKKDIDVEDEELFFAIIRASFVHRRKTILNNLGVHYQDELTKTELKNILTEAGIDPQRRGESLSIQDFAILANVFSKKL
ncbi:MAG TPA: 16S rRNA (adenine(1518)-N(6)/adenine(1519)-N(6))-dimethyltransferase RsmA [Pseudogracilibacillus sp.]|nr:16S rRNA (adenine(1518)-N(6)/adenine(1519)-N(6))-dimethyltransferase RsmA [Pseudogracilibacillus sp.]